MNLLISTQDVHLQPNEAQIKESRFKQKDGNRKNEKPIKLHHSNTLFALFHCQRKTKDPKPRQGNPVAEAQ